MEANSQSITDKIQQKPFAKLGNKFIRKKTYLGDKEKETLYIVEECNTE